METCPSQIDGWIAEHVMEATGAQSMGELKKKDIATVTAALGV